MCLAVPMEVMRVEEKVAQVELGGVRNEVRLELIDENPDVGDFVIVHAGFALRRLDRVEGLETIKLFEEGLNLELT